MPLLLSALTFFIVVKAVVRWRRSTREVSPSPIASSPVVSTKDPPWTSEPKSPSDISSEEDKIGGLDLKRSSKKTTKGPKRVSGVKPVGRSINVPRGPSPRKTSVQPLIFFSSLGGTTEAAAKSFTEKLTQWAYQLSPNSEVQLSKPALHDLSYIDYDDYFTSPPKSENDTAYFYLILAPSYDIDTQLNTFLEHLRDTHHDFRIDTAPLAGLLGYSVFGFGDAEGWPTEEHGFCYQAKEVDKWMAKLTGKRRAFPLGLGDVKHDAKERLEEWRLGIMDVLSEILVGKGLGEGVPGSGDPVESDEEDLAEEEELRAPSKKPRKRKQNLDDLEDLGRSLRDPESQPGPLAIDFTTYSKNSKPTVSPKEMVPKQSPTYSALTKQGYTIIGSHSGVKLCRWTKSALRGRGSCYKNSFYGIASHLCMETTPSLSCSNKCVFCWRHGTNPVGTTWRWVTDPPEMIFNGALEGHYRKIKALKGVPGVRAERFQEAMRVRHCALSLVGEPIFYPHINAFVTLLHSQRISSFLVCNAQHPDQLRDMVRVTQLYVSIDASNRESLRKVDRPLHRDFWERFNTCLDILREKRFQQRTVFRLTLVKGFNLDDEVRGYADLVEKGQPCFIEIKGVTYCGTSTSSAAGLTMANVPFYEEVCDFVTKLDDELERRGLGYGIAAEHAHSCCVLLASKRFHIDGKWCTIIDYERFFGLMEEGKDFGPEDYVSETPDWALWGNGGFNPADERVDRKGRKKVLG